MRAPSHDPLPPPDEGDRIRSESDAARTREIGAARADAETLRLALYADIDPTLLTSLAFNALAENLPAIGTLNLTPDVLTQALTKLGAAPQPTKD